MLVGRQAELALLGQWLDRLLAGAGGAVAVAGEAGVGKTRLMEAVGEEAAKRRVLFWRSAATPARTSMPCGLFLDAVRALSERGPRARQQARSLQPLAPHLWEVLQPHPSSRPSALPEELPAEWGLRLFISRLAQQLLEVARRQPLVLCLEDLHWADADSLRLLRHLRRKTASAPLLLLCTCRPEELGRRAEARREFFGDLDCEWLELGRLAGEETRALANACFSRAELGEELFERLQEESGGVPLFALQYLDLLVEQGAVRQRGSLWVDQPVEGAPLPAPIRAALWRRARGLSSEEQHLLSCAAVQGVEFEGGLVARIAGWPRLKALRALGRLARSTWLIDNGEGGFRFNHAGLRRLFYELLAPSEQRILHFQLAGVLEQRPATGAAALAIHFSLAGVPGLAVPYCLAAARQAREAGAYPKARGWLSQAVEMARQPASRARGGEVDSPFLGALLELAEVEGRLGAWDLAEARCLTALHCGGLQKGDSALGRVWLQLGRAHRARGEPARAASRCQEALAFFAEAGDEAGQAQAHLELGKGALEYPYLGKAAALLEEARARTLKREDKALLGEICCRLGEAAALGGRYLEAVLGCSAARRTCQQAGDEWGLCQSYYYLGEVLAAQGEWAGALRCYRHSEARARRSGATELLAQILAHQARALAHLGAEEGALAQCEAARFHAERAGNRRARAACDLAEGIACREQAKKAGAAGLWEVAAERLQQGRWGFRECGNYFGEAECELELGVLRREQGDWEGARRCWARAAEWFGQLGAAGGARRAEELLAGPAA
jgi:tetratricopeptide (TPR) repeat protein